MSIPSLEADLRAIQALNQHDVDAILAGDTAAITAQWTEDFVVLAQAGPIIRGRDANARIVQHAAEQLQTFQTEEHVVEFEEIRVCGDYAFEWGTYRGTSRPVGGGDAVSYSGRLMRILQRQPDGTWKMHRSMGTVDPPSSIQKTE